MPEDKGLALLRPGEENDPERLRRRVLETVRRFKGNWVELGKYLSLVEEEQAYRRWEFADFWAYCTRELKLKKPTVVKLLNSFRFLAREEPGYLKGALERGGSAAPVADVESVNYLRRARDSREIPETEYRRMRTSVFDEAAAPREVGKQYRSLLQAARESAEDSEAAWERRSLETARRALVSLRRVREGLESGSCLSAAVLADLKALIGRIEGELSREG